MGRLDLAFKTLAERSPRTLLDLFGHIPVDDATKIEPVERELALNIMAVDQAFVLEREGQRWIEHFEAEMVLSADDVRRILKRATMLFLRTDVPVWTTIVLLSQRYKPAARPDLIEADGGSLKLALHPRVVPLWEQTAGTVLRASVLDAVPIVGAMKATREELEEAIRRVSRIEDASLRGELTAEMLTWCSLKYNEDGVALIRERLNMVTMKEVMRLSPFGEQLAEAGREEGHLQRAHEDLLMLADLRFPGLLDSQAIESVTDLAQIKEIFKVIAVANSRDEAQAAVQKLL